MTRELTGDSPKKYHWTSTYLICSLTHVDCRGHAFFADMRGVREFEEKFETLGPLMFGLADGQSEAPKIMAKKVITDANGTPVLRLAGGRDSRLISSQYV